MKYPKPRWSQVNGSLNWDSLFALAERSRVALRQLLVSGIPWTPQRNRAKKRTYQPALEQLEPLTLMSAGPSYAPLLTPNACLDGTVIVNPIADPFQPAADHALPSGSAAYAPLHAPSVGAGGGGGGGASAGSGGGGGGAGGSSAPNAPDMPVGDSPPPGSAAPAQAASDQPPADSNAALPQSVGEAATAEPIELDPAVREERLPAQQMSTFPK